MEFGIDVNNEYINAHGGGRFFMVASIWGLAKTRKFGL